MDKIPTATLNLTLENKAMVQGINRAGDAIEIDLTGKRLYIPLSLDNGYYNPKRVTEIIKNCVQPADRAVWVISDHSKFMNYCGEDNQPPDFPDDAMRKQYGTIVSKKLSDTKGMIERIYRREFPSLTCYVRNADALINDQIYIDLLTSLNGLVASDQQVAGFLEKAVTRKTQLVYQDRETFDHTSYWQRQYVLREAAVALIYTGVLGYSCELYKHYEPEDFINHLSTLWVQEVLGVEEFNRTFVPLEPIVGEGVPRLRRSPSQRKLAPYSKREGKPKGKLGLVPPPYTSSFY